MHEFWAIQVFPFPQKRANLGLTVIFKRVSFFSSSFWANETKTHWKKISNMHCCALIRLQSLLCLAQSTKPLRIKKTGDLEFLAKTILWNRPKNIYSFFMALLFVSLISQQQCARKFVNLQIYQPTIANYGNVYFCRV